MFKCCSGHFFVLYADKKEVSALWACGTGVNQGATPWLRNQVCGQQHRTAGKQHRGVPHQSHDLGATVIAADACKGVD